MASGPPHPQRLSALLLGLAMLLVAPTAVLGQQASVQGLVTAATTGAPLDGALVVLERDGDRSYSTLTDRNGFYQIGGIEPGTFVLRSRFLGYDEHEQELTVEAGDRLTVSIEMATSAVTLEGVTVSAGGGGAAVRELGRQRVTPGDLRLVPVPAGTGDLASYLQTLPGVVTTGDRGGQLFVRGGTPAENLILVDGVPIYQPFHILGFFSVFPEDLVSSVDFYAGGFGARYNGRTSSVLDVQMRDGNPNEYAAVGSVSPFLAEVVAEGPGGTGVSWLASVRRSLVEETSPTFIGSRQPVGFNSQMVKVSANDGEDLRCSALALHTADEGRLDPSEQDSRVEWSNTVVGGRCVALFDRILRLLEVNFSYSSVDNAAVSRGSSRFDSSLGRLQHDGHVTNMLRSIPIYAGYYVYLDFMQHNLTELFGVQRSNDGIRGLGGYLEAALPVASTLEVRPGAALTGSPRMGIEPRLRASWKPFGTDTEQLQGAVGMYRQDLVGTSDMRDVGSVFTAWMLAPDERPVEALHGMLGWQQTLGPVQWSMEGYYKSIEGIPVPAWSAIARFNTRLIRADGEVYGADARVEVRLPRFHAFVGYGYSVTEYAATQPEFSSWFGNAEQRYNPPHDRRHQINAVTTFDVAGFTASARWQLGTGLPFTRPMGFDEAFDYSTDLHDVSQRLGTTRLILDRPFTGRLPVMHRLDVSLEREWDTLLGQLAFQVGAVNVYDRRNMFYYDLFTGRRVDQLPLAPYVSVRLKG